MKRREAFKMFLKPGCEAEYQRRHAAIWPELKKLLSDSGVSNYSIYWDKQTNIIFACQSRGISGCCTARGRSSCER